MMCEFTITIRLPPDVKPIKRLPYWKVDRPSHDWTAVPPQYNYISIRITTYKEYNSVFSKDIENFVTQQQKHIKDCPSDGEPQKIFDALFKYATEMNGMYKLKRMYIYVFNGRYNDDTFKACIKHVDKEKVIVE